MLGQEGVERLWRTVPGMSSRSCTSRSCAQMRHSWSGGTGLACTSDTGHTSLPGWTWPARSSLSDNNL